MKQWRNWAPHAAFFHFGTRSRRHVPLDEVTAVLEQRLLLDPPPPPLKPVVRTTVPLEPYPATNALARVLKARRSWRRFARGVLTRRELAMLLGHTWGVERWMHVRPGVRFALKTSPSGGACHSLEAYVVAQRVRGLARGIYRYDADRHRLELIRRGLPRDPAITYLRQPWFSGSAALFCMTSVWARVQWKYHFARAYRAVLIEAGHFAQTFCLLATSLRLAPFSTGAFDDRALEHALRVDGISEGALFVVGVGRRPGGTRWAPWPDVSATPPTRMPAHRRTRVGARRK
jgi:SagB-type dehydrogenase family enzyme